MSVVYDKVMEYKNKYSVQNINRKGRFYEIN